MVYGAAAAGVRTMTSSSSPGISLKQEGISYIAASELPCVIANVQRGGPGLGNIAPGQADYFQSVKGGGHGDYHLIVLAPWSVQEIFELTVLAFDLADKYRNPALILGDAIIGQMIEPIDVPDQVETHVPEKPWATNGRKNRPRNVINSLWIKAEVMEELNRKLQAKYREIEANEVRYQEIMTEDAELVLVAYGVSARMAGLRLVSTVGAVAGSMHPLKCSNR
jgi:2-oxoglutarate ferredoxin oxidoreductase subunit alpha